MQNNKIFKNFIGLSIFIGSLILYSLTLAPGLLWGGGDFATFQTAAFLGDIEIDRGIFSHPLWVILAHPFTKLPFRDVAWRANFASAFFASLALFFIFLSAYKITQSVWASSFGAVSLGLSHTFWTYAVMPKVYSLNALLISLCFLLLLIWREKRSNKYLYLFSFIYGLSILNHIVMAILVGGFAIFIILQLRETPQTKSIVSVFIKCCIFFLLGLSPYLYFSIRIGTSSTIIGVMIGFFRGLLSSITSPSALLKAIIWGIPLGVYQFPLTFIPGLVGLYVLRKTDLPLALNILLIILGTFLFLLAAAEPGVGSVYVWNLHYYLQAYVVFAIAIAVGFKALENSWKPDNLLKVCKSIGFIVVVPVFLYALAPNIAPIVWTEVPDFRPLPGRNNFEYVLSPWKQNETGAREFGVSVLDSLPTKSILIADYSIWAVIRYLQVVDGYRRDVNLIKLPGYGDQVELVLKYKDCSDVYFPDTYRYYNLEEIDKYFMIIPEGRIFRLVYKGLP